MRCSKVLVGLLLMTAGLSACMRAQAKTPVVVPPLSIPEPPKRIVPEPARDDSAPVPPVPPPAPASPPPVAATRPDRGSPQTSAPALPPAPPPEPPPPLLLQTDADPKAEKQIRDQMAIALRNVERAATRPLTVNGQTQLDATRGLLRQADEALTAHNLRLARELADKAAALASQLAR